MRVTSSFRLATILAFSLAALLATACSDDLLAPSEVAGTYVLLSINGNALPAPAGYDGPADGPVIVIADTLRLAADRSGSLVRVEQPGSDPSSVVRHDSPLHYTSTEGGIAITFDCPPNALMSCAPGPHLTARLGPSGLVAVRPLGSQQEDLEYSRVERLD